MGRNHYGMSTGKTFRLSVCLKRFFSDERARCYITADAGLRFRWLAARMRRLFGLQGAFCLVTRGHLLPPDEPVGLLDADDLIEVIPKHYKIFPDTSESDVSERSNESDIEDVSNEKHSNIVPAEIRDIRGHREEHNVKLFNIACQSHNIDVSNKGLTENQGLLKEKNESVPIISRNFKNVESGQLEEAEKEKLDEGKKKALELLDQLGVPPKRKRKRVRRRKLHAFVQEPAADTHDAADSEDICDGPGQGPLSRRRCAPDGTRGVTDSQTNIACVDNIPEKSTSDGFIPMEDADSLILRNNTEQSRSARLVRSLS